MLNSVRKLLGDNEQIHIDNLRSLRDQISKELEDAIITNRSNGEISMLRGIKSNTELLLADLLSKQKAGTQQKK